MDLEQESEEFEDNNLGVIKEDDELLMKQEEERRKA